MSSDQPLGAPGDPANTPIGPPPGPPAGPPPGPPPGPPLSYQLPPASGPAPGYGPPASYGPPPATGPPRRRGVGAIVVSIIAVLALLASGIAVFLVLRADPSEAGEVFLEAAEVPGPDPFTTQIKVEPLPSTTTTSTTSTTTATSTSSVPSTTGGGATAVAATIGSQPGLYGGTQNIGRCDPKQLVTFLEANPDKARAWVDALNGDPSLRWSGGTQVQVGQIRAYVSELTPLTLTGDTRVTNYGYANGRPTPRQAVLQRGTAVLVDAYGVPRTKCGCGNPLTRPVAVPSAPKYQGPPWPGWNPVNVVVVQQTTIVVNTFVIVNLSGPGYLDRPAGSTGDRDTTSSYTGPGSATTASTATTEPRTTTPPSSTATTTATTTVTTTTSVIPSTTASTGPVPTLTPPDFCAQFQATQTKWGDVSADTPAQRAELMDDVDRLAAAAPAEVQADMTAIAKWLRPALLSGNLDIANVPADVQGALARVEAYLKNVCGITTG